MADAHQAEIDRNYDFFQRSLARLLPDYEGQFALIHHAELAAFFDTAGEAYRAGLARYPDRLFSIQLVSGEPVELGNWSVAVA